MSELDTATVDGPVETGTETVRAEIRDGVGVITLNRAERRNALHPEMYDAVPALIERFSADEQIGCILLTAAGSAFCAGGDVRDGGSRAKKGEPERTIEERTAMLTGQARMVRLMHESPKVTLAALPGAAVGAGIGVALCTDLRIAAESASLVPGWGALAFSGDFGGIWFMSQLIGRSRAIEVLTDSAPVTAARALEIGLFNRVVPDDQLADAAFAWAKAIAAGPSTAYAASKANLDDAERLSLAEYLPLESERMVRSGTTKEHRDAVRRWMAAAEAKRAARAGSQS